MTEPVDLDQPEDHTEAACAVECVPVHDLIGEELPEGHNPWAEDGEETHGDASA